LPDVGKNHSRGLSRLRSFLKTSFPPPTLTRLRNTRIFDWMNLHAPGRRVLNLGSGLGGFDYLLHPSVEMVAMDICPSKPNLDVVGDAHRLPFKNGSFDIVYSIAVLEHVAKPWIVADEIFRILKPGGFVVLELPFLNVIHDAHDYFRFTDLGIRSLFDRFVVVFEQVSAGGGSFLSIFSVEYFAQFIPGEVFRKCLKRIFLYFSVVFKFLDVFIDSSPNLRITANSFSFIGQKK